MLSIKARFARLSRLIREDKIIRQQWTDGERVCLLAGLSPEVAEKKDSAACPASVVPPWFAHLTPSMDDNGTAEAWPAFVRRYARVVRKAALELDAAGWRRAEYRVRGLAVEEAMKNTDDAGVLKVCSVVVDLCRREVAGSSPTDA